MLIAGGVLFTPLESAEVYDPTRDSWSSTAGMGQSRASHTAVLLENGDVLVAGGVGSGPDTAEVYDVSVGEWASTGGMTELREEHTATLLGDGRVLVAGGFAYDQQNRRIPTAEMYDPATGIWGSAGSLRDARSGHTATLLKDGRVLVTGGLGEGSILGLASVEVYDTRTGTWSSAAKAP